MNWSPTPMRRAGRKMPHEAALTLLAQGEYGTLASADAAGIPLATPLSYVMLDNALYFHCALKGQKLENLANQPRVCFCVLGRTQPIYTDDFTTYYESVLAHGRATLVAGEDERTRALMALCEKYLPDAMAHAPDDIGRSGKATAIVRIDLDEVSGKSNWPAEG